MYEVIELYFDFFEEKYQMMLNILNPISKDFSVHIPFLLHLIHLIVRIKNNDITIERQDPSLNIIISKEIEEEIQSIENKLSISIPQHERITLVKILLNKS
jgi:transcriptional regulatory protein LevR